MPILIIGGMHRSGTTLAARWLQECGLFVGDDLLQSRFNHANPAGLHYEDTAFLALHRTILAANGFDTDGYVTTEAIEVAPRFRQRAEELVTSRQQAQWGWKEPRTCLFMDLWRSLLPEAYLFIVYRPYELVADSLMRRKLNHPRLFRRWYYHFRMRDHATQAAHYIRVWTRYNRDLVAAADRAPDKTLLIGIEDLVAQSSQVNDFLNVAWGFDLAAYAVANIYERKRLHRQSRYVNLEHPVVKRAAAEADEILARLQQWRATSLSRLGREDR